MKRFGWQWLVISSLLWLCLAAVAETRPQYGGTLRVAMHSPITSLDPADSAQQDSFVRRNLMLIVYETLVTVDGSGRPRPELAVSWQKYAGPQPANQRWEFRLRRAVKFHDGSDLTAEVAASSLRTANPSWNVSVSADSVVIEADAADAELLAELSLPRNAIVKRNAQGILSGTGPFHISAWQVGKKLSLAAEENSWRGRPFLDAIEIETSKNFHDQLTALDLGGADVVEVAPEQSRRVSAEGRAVASSAPMELLALLFSRDVNDPDDGLLRQALALSGARGPIRRGRFQGAGQEA